MAEKNITPPQRLNAILKDEETKELLERLQQEGHPLYGRVMRKITGERRSHEEEMEYQHRQNAETIEWMHRMYAKLSAIPYLKKPR